MKSGARIAVGFIITLSLFCAITTAYTWSDQIGLFRPSTGKWYIDTDLNGASDKSFTWGASGDTPVVGNWI